MDIAVKLIVIAIIGYLLGATPSGLMIGKLVGKIDITKVGSGNVGGTNVIRSVGFGAGVIVIIMDLGKAMLAAWLARTIMGESLIPMAGFPIDMHVAEVIAALMAMIGHNWSLYIKFRGGKGAATYFGGWFMMFPLYGLYIGLFGGIILIVTVLLSKFMSRGTILGTLGIWLLLVPLTIWFEFPKVYLIYALIATGMIIYQHRENIGRLQRGTELHFFGKGAKRNLKADRQ